MNAPAPILGVVPGLSNEEYHASAGISKSGLDYIAHSPFMYYSKCLDPQRPPRREKAGQLEGTLFHAALFEPAEFSARYSVGPNCRRGTKEWAAFEEHHPGVEVIKPEQYDTAWRQADACRRIGEVADLMSSGHAEQSMFWIDHKTGVLCRCRPDWRHQSPGCGHVLIDGKTCGNASADEFARTSAKKRYHVQGAIYSDGTAEATGSGVDAFLFLAVESEWPYAAALYALAPASMELGRDAYQQDLATYAYCLRSGLWPGLTSGVQEIQLPAYAFPKTDEEIEVEYV